MRCAFPVSGTSGSSFGCGQCMPCRINSQRKWVARLLLESWAHPESWFVTLTYAPEHLPLTSEGVPTLNPVHLQQFLKRVRFDVGPGLRFFAVGEYGTQTWRPHYHLILFGELERWLGLDKKGRVQFNRPGWWPFGFHSVGESQLERLSYAAHYTTKKLTRCDDERLGGRVPEFMRSSRKPGIGVPGIPYLREVMATPEGRKVLEELGDVLRQFRVDGKLWPLDRLMTDRLRMALDVPIESANRPPVPRDLNPVFREVTADEQEAARQAHDRLVRKARRHGSL